MQETNEAFTSLVATLLLTSLGSIWHYNRQARTGEAHLRTNQFV
jgi:hypothetical protein